MARPADRTARPLHQRAAAEGNQVLCAAEEGSEERACGQCRGRGQTRKGRASGERHARRGRKRTRRATAPRTHARHTTQTARHAECRWAEKVARVWRGLQGNLPQATVGIHGAGVRLVALAQRGGEGLFRVDRAYRRARAVPLERCLDVGGELFTLPRPRGAPEKTLGRRHQTSACRVEHLVQFRLPHHERGFGCPVA